MEQKQIKRRTWTKEEAQEYMTKVEMSKAKKGLKYWSAYDFLNRKH